MTIKDTIKNKLINIEEVKNEIDNFDVLNEYEYEEVNLADEFDDKKDYLDNNIIRIKKSAIPTKAEKENPDIKMNVGDIQILAKDKLPENGGNKITAKIISILDYKVFSRKTEDSKGEYNIRFKKSEVNFPIEDDGLDENNKTRMVSYFEKNSDGKYTRNYDSSKNKDNKFIQKSAIRLVLEYKGTVFNYWFNGLGYQYGFPFINTVYKNSTKTLTTNKGEIIPLAKDQSYKTLNFMLNWDLVVKTGKFNNHDTFGLFATNPRIDDETSMMLEKMIKKEITKDEYNKYLCELKTKINKIKEKI